jgi:Flp pilus assembly pilin Flp
MTSQSVRNSLVRLWRCSRGVASLEYALMAAIISTATVTTVVSVGQRLDDKFRYTLAAFSADGDGEESEDKSAKKPDDDEVAAKDNPATDKAAAKAAKEAEKAAKEAAKKAR